MDPAAATAYPAEPASQADAVALAEAEAEGVDADRLADAQRGAEEVVDSLDEVNREEFYLLFGADPLGLSTNPANAARYEIPLETNEAVERWIDFLSDLAAVRSNRDVRHQTDVTAVTSGMSPRQTRAPSNSFERAARPRCNDVLRPAAKSGLWTRRPWHSVARTISG